MITIRPMQPYHAILAMSLFATLVPSVALAENEMLNCVSLLAGPADKPLVERISKAYETLLRGNGIAPASMSEYAALAAKAGDARLSDFFGFKEAASPEQAVVQDGLRKLGEMVEARIKVGEITEESAQATLAGVVRGITDRGNVESVEQSRVATERQLSEPLRTIRIDAKAKRALTSFELAFVHGVATPDGQMLALAEKDRMNRSIVVLSPISGKLLLADNAGEKHDSILSFAFSPDGQFLAAATGKGSLCVWNTRTWRRWTKKLPPSTVPLRETHLVFSPNSTQIYFATNAHYSTVEGFETATGKNSFSAVLDETKNIIPYNIAITPDGLGLAVLSAHLPEEYPRTGLYIDVFDTQTSEKTYTSKRFPMNAVHVDYPKDTFQFGAKGEIQIGDRMRTSVWKLKNRKPEPWAKTRATDPFTSPSGRYFAAYYSRRTVQLYDSTRRALISLKTPNDLIANNAQFAANLGDFAFLFSPDESRLIGIPLDGSNFAEVWEVPSGKYLGTRELGNENGRFVCTSSREAYLVTEDGVLRALNLGTTGEM